jgi:Mycobacterium membrane protein
MLDPTQQQHAPPPPPPWRRRRWALILLSPIALLGLLAMAVALPTHGVPVANPPPAPATVVHEVEGAGTASSISYATGGTPGVVGEASARLPWRKEVQVMQRGVSTTTVTVQNKSSGEIRCRITVDGKVIKEVASSGLFTVVSCAGPA